MQIAARLGTAFCLAEFLDRDRSILESAAIMSEYREMFKPSLQMPEPRCSIAIAGICAESDWQAQRLLSAPQPITVVPRAVGSPVTCSRVLSELHKKTAVTDFVFLDLCQKFSDRVMSHQLLASVLIGANA